MNIVFETKNKTGYNQLEVICVLIWREEVQQVLQHLFSAPKNMHPLPSKFHRWL
jgi:hypothetical protein